MIKGALCIAVVGLLLAGGSMHAATTRLDDGQLDQEQTQQDGGLYCLFEDELAQGFVPEMDMLTKIELLMTRNQTVVPGLEIAIREHLSGGSLDVVDVAAEQVPTGSYEWVTIDLDDLHVEPGETYYIVWTGWHGATADQTYYWGYGEEDPYPEGHSHYYDEADDEWHRFADLWTEDIDFCFKTYGATNQPPAVPEQPAGKSYLEPGTAYNYTTVTTDPENDQVRYCFDWDDATNCTWTSLHQSGEGATASHVFRTPGTHDITVKAADRYGKESAWSSAYTVSVADEPPGIPSITGPTTGKAGVSYNYTISATDPNREQLRFRVTWGDGAEDVTSYHPSGKPVELSHTWAEEGGYTVSVQAENSKTSETAYLQVSMPKPRDTPRWLFERLPPLLRHLAAVLAPGW